MAKTVIKSRSIKTNQPSSPARAKQLQAFVKTSNFTTENIIEEPRWWEAQNIPWQLVQELRRRKSNNNIGQDYPSKVPFDVTGDFFTHHKDYKGPLTPWIRAFSNGTGRVGSTYVPKSKYLYKNDAVQTYNGFLLEGGHGFNQAYGFKRNGNVLDNDKAIIGFQANGEPHYIDTKYRDNYKYSSPIDCNFPQRSNVPSVIPPPGIISIDIKTSKDMLSFATIKWRCYTLAQLEYMTPFWLSPKINVFLEFGWNLYNIDSLLDLTDLNECRSLIRTPQIAVDRWYDSYGNYGLVTGIITKYNFSTNDGIVYDCTTEITSRQAMYSGFRVDNPVSTFYLSDNGNNPNTVEHLTLKNFMKTYLTAVTAKDVLRANMNYVEYLYTKKNISIAKQGVDSDPNLIRSPKEDVNYFYEGKSENRIFVPRIESIYGAAANFKPRSVGGTGTYGYAPVVPPPGSYYDIPSVDAIQYGTDEDGARLISDLDTETDFDAPNPSATDRVWYQLDFVFEVINLFCEENYTKNNRIDISDTVIGAHPNLISCDSDILIPNPVAPKFNKGRIPSSTKEGFLEQDDIKDSSGNIVNEFPYQWSFDDWNGYINDADKFRNELSSSRSECEENSSQPPWQAAIAQYNAFKTLGAPRDNLDTIINKLYYQKQFESRKNNKQRVKLASFPAAIDINIKQNDGNENVYKRYYNGYLKHIYISSNVLVNLGSDSSIKTLSDLVKSILDRVNNSVDGFWNLDIVENARGGLGVIDKNVNFQNAKNLYAFDLGTTNSFVKSYDLQVNMTNEQTVQALYGAGQNTDATVETVIKKIDEIKKAGLPIQEQMDRITTVSKMPGIVYRDRFEDEELQQIVNNELEELLAQQEEKEKLEKDTSKNSTSTANIPKGPFKEKNEEIRQLQIYGKGNAKDAPLTMRLRKLSANHDLNDRGQIIDKRDKSLVDATKLHNWVNLTLPSYMKERLRQMLDDGDLTNNTSTYAGPADNFTLQLTLDGIFGFRMFQHFAVMNLPKPYVPGNVIFQISEVSHQLSGGKWETNITAMLRCVGTKRYNYIVI